MKVFENDGKGILEPYARTIDNQTYNSHDTVIGDSLKHHRLPEGVSIEIAQSSHEEFREFLKSKKIHFKGMSIKIEGKVFEQLGNPIQLRDESIFGANAQKVYLVPDNMVSDHPMEFYEENLAEEYEGQDPGFDFIFTNQRLMKVHIEPRTKMTLTLFARSVSGYGDASERPAKPGLFRRIWRYLFG